MAQGSYGSGRRSCALLAGSSPPPVFGCLVLGLPLVRLGSFSFLVARRGATDCIAGRQAQYKQTVPWKLSRSTTALWKDLRVGGRARRRRKKTNKQKNRPEKKKKNTGGPSQPEHSVSTTGGRRWGTVPAQTIGLHYWGAGPV